jgi:uncharacterized protein (DUF2225 family)
MVSPVFAQEQTCPVCATKFSVQRVRSSALRIARRDTDYCIYYEGPNPFIYSVWVCPECHYAATDQQFNITFSDFQIDRLKKGLDLLKRTEPDFSGERNWDTVIRGCELAIRTAQIYQAKTSYLGALFLRAAWACRFAGQPAREKEFISEAANQYQKAYEGDSHHTKTSEPKMLYLIGELHRRAGRPKESIIWYSRAVSHPNAKQEAEVERLARDQWFIAKSEAKALAELTENASEDTDESSELSESTLNSSSPEAVVIPDAAADTVTPSPVKSRPMVSMMMQVYQDQATWLQATTNKAYDQHHQILEKTTIVRAILDAVNQIEIPPASLKDEQSLREFLQQCLK